MKVVYTKSRWISNKYYKVKNAVCIDRIFKSTIVFIKNYKIHNVYGAALIKLYGYSIQKDYYNGTEIKSVVINYSKNNIKKFSWKKEVANIKRELKLKIFL